MFFSATFFTSTFLTTVATLFAISFSPVQALAQRAIDPLSQGPLAFTDEQAAETRVSYTDGLIYTDQQCYLKPEDIKATEIDLAKLPANICRKRTQEIVYSPSFAGVVGCLNEAPQFAMKVSIGTHGLGKTREGNRKSPVGTYWLGYPRKSLQFGIFIPVGYPNMANISKGYTGSAIGLHGPMRFMTCLPQKSLEKNWTAGCLAVGRDSQIIEVSEWILNNWPAKLTVLAK